MAFSFALHYSFWPMFGACGLGGLCGHQGSLECGGLGWTLRREDLRHLRILPWRDSKKCEVLYLVDSNEVTETSGMLRRCSPMCIAELL